MNLHLAPEQVDFKHAEDLTVASDHNWWEGGERKAVEAVLRFSHPGRGWDSRHDASRVLCGKHQVSIRECFMSWDLVWGKLSAGPPLGQCSHLVPLL